MAHFLEADELARRIQKLQERSKRNSYIGAFTVLLLLPAIVGGVARYVSTGWTVAGGAAAASLVLGLVLVGATLLGGANRNGLRGTASVWAHVLTPHNGLLLFSDEGILLEKSLLFIPYDGPLIRLQGITPLIEPLQLLIRAVALSGRPTGGIAPRMFKVRLPDDLSPEWIEDVVTRVQARADGVNRPPAS